MCCISAICPAASSLFELEEYVLMSYTILWRWQIVAIQFLPISTGVVAYCPERRHMDPFIDRKPNGTV
jgi:hypothetical protein